MYYKCNALESSANHPPAMSVEKLSSTKVVPGARKVEEHCRKCFHCLMLPKFTCVALNSHSEL